MEHSHIVRSEDARSRQYRKRVDEKRALLREVTQQIGRPRSGDWTRGSLPRAPQIPDGQLIARIALDSPDDQLDGRDFYIGSHPSDRDGFSVFSWAAPVAQTLYSQPRRGEQEHEWCGRVVGRRTFAYKRGSLADFQDEFVNGAPRSPDEVFPLTESVKIRAPRQRPGKSSLSRFAGATKRPAPPTNPPGQQRKAVRTDPAEAPSKRAAAGMKVPPLRAERILRQALGAPRTSSLSSVLHTLQPDQYHAITAPDDKTWIFRGGPGTGKTIIAAHRACYLTSKARHDERLENVVILGPTEGWVQHIRPIVGQLDLSNSVTVRSLPELLAELAGLPAPTGSDFGPYDEVAPERFEDCLTVAYDLRQAQRALTPRSVYQVLRRRVAAAGASHSLPAWDDARTKSRYLPIIAACAIAARRPLPEWQHIIVDEAQDVRPLEWTLISHMTASEETTLTLLGDLNQRRHLTTYRTWKQVVDSLRHYHEGLQASGREIRTGYRSTRQILNYAMRLVPKTDRPTHVPIQTGPPVGHLRARDEATMWREALKATIALSCAYREGTVAIITPHTASAVAELKRAGGKAGDWRRYQWIMSNGAPISILEPSKARGLEFDAVVVVEPADFPRDEFGSGSLFTSLTRANRELRIVHSKPLPEELRRKRR